MTKDCLVVSEGGKLCCVSLMSFMVKEGAPLPTIVQKSMVVFFNATTDLAAIEYRCRVPLRADRRLYVVDKRVKACIFPTSICDCLVKAAKWCRNRGSTEHNPPTADDGEDGRAFQTRSGDNVIILIEPYLEESVRRAHCNCQREESPSAWMRALVCKNRTKL